MIRETLETMINELNRTPTAQAIDPEIDIDRKVLETFGIQGEIDAAYWLSDGFEVYYM